MTYVTCFAEGTLIATAEGKVAIEALHAGQLVTTPKGGMPVKWLALRAVKVLNQRELEENWLVCIG